MATAAAYASTPVMAVVNSAAANTARDGTGTLITLLAGATNGTRVDDILIKAAVTTTAGTVRFFLSTDGGTTKRLIMEIAVTANTVSASNPAWSYGLTNLGIVLANTSCILYVTSEKAESINFAVTRAGSF